MGLIKNIRMMGELKKIYGLYADEQVPRYQMIEQHFRNTFEGKGDVTFFSTSGRSEIIGNHTDHNHGCVMAAGISLDAVACVRATEGNTVRLLSEGYPEMNVIDLADTAFREQEKGTTVALIRGIAARLKGMGKNVGGFDAYVQSNVFAGSGLSSSAAIEVLLYTIFNYLYNEGKLDAVEGAKVSQWAENNYFGKPCGLMDQTACALGRLVSIDFNNPEEPVIESLEFDFAKSGYSIIITDVHADHADLTDEYAAITREMRTVANFFGKDFLRDVPEEEFYAGLGKLRATANDRAVLRAMHYYDENRRVGEAVAAIRGNEVKKFLKAIRESGESSWKLLQNTHASGSVNQAMTLALALSTRLLNGDGAVRVHGGGFGGTILAFVPIRMTAEYIEKMETVFGINACTKLVIRPVGTTKVDL